MISKYSVFHILNMVSSLTDAESFEEAGRLRDLVLQSKGTK